jgi:hypothetical protein
MWCRVNLVWNDVSEECVASIFKVEKSASEEPAWVGDWFLARGLFYPAFTNTLRLVRWLRMSLPRILWHIFCLSFLQLLDDLLSLSVYGTNIQDCSNFTYSFHLPRTSLISASFWYILQNRFRCSFNIRFIQRVYSVVDLFVIFRSGFVSSVKPLTVKHLISIDCILFNCPRFFSI